MGNTLIMRSDASLLTDSARPSISPLSPKCSREIATLVLGALVLTLQSSPNLSRFMAAFPLSRTCLLLLGGRPSSSIATQILKLVQQGLHASTSFAREMETAHGWLVLKFALPGAWSATVQQEALNILLGRCGASDSIPVNVSHQKRICRHIFPAIIASLIWLMEQFSRSLLLESNAEQPQATHNHVEELPNLLDELIALHTDHAFFRALFKSEGQIVTFASAYRLFVTNLEQLVAIQPHFVKVIESINHFALLLALDESSGASHKRSVCGILPLVLRLLMVNSDSSSRHFRGLRKFVDWQYRKGG